jgi:hypothetical protein
VDPPKTRVPNTQSPAPWAEVEISELSSRQRVIGRGPDGKRRYEVRGLFKISLRMPVGGGLNPGLSVTRILKDAFRGTRSGNGVWFPEVSSSEEGIEGSFYLFTVNGQYVYDEFK